MRIRVLTACGVLLLCAIGVAQAADKPLHADRVMVLKSERTLQLLNQGKVIKSYKVALGGDPVGAKTQQGDHKTPEGVYVLDSRNAHSKFYKSIHISYPSARERAGRAEKGASPGGTFCAWTAERIQMGGGSTPGQGGRTGASRSPIRRSTRSGWRYQTELDRDPSLNATSLLLVAAGRDFSLALLPTKTSPLATVGTRLELPVPAAILRTWRMVPPDTDSGLNA
jgi:hypothetical protein